MRSARWILLLAILGIVVAIGGSYHFRKARQIAEAPAPPRELPPNIEATSQAWVHTEYEGERPVVEIRAQKMRQIREPSEFELEGVELRIFDKSQDGSYDRVRSALASFDIARGVLYSEGQVEITLDVPPMGPEENRMVIRTSGLRFDTKTEQATTERPTSFSFDRGEGSSVGATYEPKWAEIRMHSQARLKWYGANGDAGAMVVEAGELVYKWDLDKVDLNHWSRFKKGPLTLNGGDSIVYLKDGAIRRVTAQKARGTSRQGERLIDFSSEQMQMFFDDAERLDRILGTGGSWLRSRIPSSETDVASRDLTLAFRQSGADDLLESALAKGSARVESRPITADGKVAPPSELLRSDIIKTVMRPSGEAVDRIETQAPGTLELLPREQRRERRRLDARRITIQYDDANRLRSLRAMTAHTRTEQPPPPKGKAPPPVQTWSDWLEAVVNSKTGDWDELRQWGHFRYESGNRRARAERASLDAARNQIVLVGKARLQDEQGSTSADNIVINQKDNVLSASGHVSSTRLPEPGRATPGMLSAKEPVYATAARMQGTADGSFISYLGNVVLWQGANRLTADKVDINRKQGILTATGHVLSRFRETPAATGKKTSGGEETYTVVRARKLTYLEKFQSAHYEGGVDLSRGPLDIRGDELTAYFKEGKGKPGEPGALRLNHTLADGAVTITQKTADRTRRGLSEHAAYYVDEDKVVLTGGRPKLIDSLRGSTQGQRLTYYARNDRLLVDGASNQPAVSKLRKN